MFRFRAVAIGLFLVALVGLGAVISRQARTIAALEHELAARPAAAAVEGARPEPRAAFIARNDRHVDQVRADVADTIYRLARGRGADRAEAYAEARRSLNPDRPNP